MPRPAARSRISAGVSKLSVIIGAPAAARSAVVGLQELSAVRPGAAPRAEVEPLGAVRLLVARRVDRVAGAADALPGRDAELVEPAVQPAAADGARVVAGLAAGQGGPVEVV